MLKKIKKQRQKKKRISEALAIVSLIINIIIMPGLGSLIGGRTKEGIWQLVLFFVGIFLGILSILTIGVIGVLIGIFILVGGLLSAWIWGIVTGIQLIKESQK